MSSASSLLVTQLRNNPVIPLYMCPAGFALTVVSTFSLVQGFPAQSCCSQHGRSYQRQPQQRLLGAHQHNECTSTTFHRVPLTFGATFSRLNALQSSWVCVWPAPGMTSHSFLCTPAGQQMISIIGLHRILHWPTAT